MAQGSKTFSFAPIPPKRYFETALSGGVMVAQGPLEAFVMVQIHAGQPLLPSGQQSMLAAFSQRVRLGSTRLSTAMDQPPPILFSQPEPAKPPAMSLAARLLNVFAIPSEVFSEVKT